MVASCFPHRPYANNLKYLVKDRQARFVVPLCVRHPELVERSGSASSDCVSYSCLPSLPRFLAEMGNCNSSNVNAESAEVQVADAQRHPSLLTLKMRTNVKFGWKPDMPDHRDHHVTFDTVSAPSQIKRKAEGAPACL